MKKTITFILSMLLVLSLVACGNQTDSVGKIDEDKQQTEQVDSTQQTEQGESTQQTDSTQQNETNATEEEQQTEVSETEENVIYTMDTVPKPFEEAELADDASWYDVGDTEATYSHGDQRDMQPMNDYMELLAAEGFTVSEFEQGVHPESDRLLYSAEATHGNARVEIRVFPQRSFEDAKTYGPYTSWEELDENTQYNFNVKIYVE